MAGCVWLTGCFHRSGAHHTVQDVANCFCDLERGEHYYKPQVVLGPNSCCQMITPSCHRGHQPTQTGVMLAYPLSLVIFETQEFIRAQFYNCLFFQDGFIDNVFLPLIVGRRKHAPC